ncbi:MAG: DUF2207 domain-containing protein [Herbiconiux sp.]|nr:DUF2207 domain-containing protein [Herbiconiux sp.]
MRPFASAPRPTRRLARVTAGGLLGAVLALAVGLGLGVGVPTAAHAEAPTAEAPAAATAPATTAATSSTTAPALQAIGVAPRDVNDFTFASFDARYDLGRDAEGHSTLDTVETFVAQFPETDQNRGIQRAIPQIYQGHRTDLDLVSVTDETGTPRPYETESDDENLIVTIAGDDYVHGEQTYVLHYTQRDVTGSFENTGDDEFYWDTNGTLWRQPFAVHTTTTVVAPELVGALTGSTACFVGPQGSGTPCTITEATASEADAVAGEPVEPGSAVFTTRNEGLQPRDNVTIGVAFETQTFVQRDVSYLSSPSSWVQLAGTLGALVVLVLAIVYRVTRLRDAPGRPVIVAEFTPLRDADLMLVAAVLKRTPRAAAASFVDLAVRHNLQIVEQQEEGVFSTKSAYWLRLVTAQGLSGPEQALARILFGAGLEPGAWRELKKKDTALARSIYGLLQSTKKRVVAEGYRSSALRGTGSLLLIATIVLAGAAFVGGLFSTADGLGEGLPLLLLFVDVALVFVVSAVAFRSPLTAKGAELRDYVKGLEMYMKWAEEDRFKALQSPEGALRTGVDAPDWGQVVKLYEKLLPYAVLLDLESEWAKVLGTYYESLGSQPEWYGGSTAFNAALFASSISSMSSTAASSYSGSSSSSSSGFSGGGGYSGGGGGGGGGGGV